MRESLILLHTNIGCTWKWNFQNVGKAYEDVSRAASELGIFNYT